MKTETTTFEIEVEGTTYECVGTSSAQGVFSVDMAVKGDDESLLPIQTDLSGIYQDLIQHGECEIFQDAMGRDGEHTTIDSKLDPEDVWEEFSEKQKCEFIEDDIVQQIKYLTKSA